jgi:8-oxo-dGTP pyrophosphatase MutT (NUDIX family)
MSAYYQTRIPKGATKVFNGIMFDVHQWQQELFDGSTTTFEMAKKRDGVSVVAIKDDKIIILHEEQPTRPPFWSTPGGHLDSHDESPFDAAERELLEETGMKFGTLKLVAVEFAGNSKLEWYAYRFVATDFISQQEPRPEAGERIVVHEMSYDEVKQMSTNNPFASQWVFQHTDSIEDILGLRAIEKIQ